MIKIKLTPGGGPGKDTVETVMIEMVRFDSIITSEFTVL